MRMKHGDSSGDIRSESYGCSSIHDLISLISGTKGRKEGRKGLFWLSLNVSLFCSDLT